MINLAEDLYLFRHFLHARVETRTKVLIRNLERITTSRNGTTNVPKSR
tara:strand:- start:899 stop:1042 length:144 start_codon:yes stop_codon:yes gene_type:complete